MCAINKLSTKPLQAVAIGGIIVTVLLAGTFAWSSFTQTRLNMFRELVVPDVNLHDDFADASNKDVYVENSGRGNIFLRVRLTEYLQTATRGSLLEGHRRDDHTAQLWAPHNATENGVAGSVESCTLMDGNKNSAAWGNENFHDYYIWQLGGNAENPTAQIYYLPATREQRSEYDLNDVLIREPQVVENPLTGTLPGGDAHLYYAEQIKELLENGASQNPPITTEEQAMKVLGIKKTKTASVMNMVQWKTGDGTREPYAKGDYWVIDPADGWCYWANALPGGQATGLLLDKVTRTQKAYDSDAEYAINVWLQATDQDNLGSFEMPNVGGITEDGKKLLQLAADKLIIAADKAEYRNNGDGSYTKTKNDDGTAVNPPEAPFVPLGTDSVNETDRLTLGARVTLVDELLWNGVAYENYDEQNAKTPPMYNLQRAPNNAVTDNGKQIYEFAGSKKGRDGNVYLQLVAVVQQGTDYVASGDAQYMASMKQTAGTPNSYRVGYPGTAPYGEVFAGIDGAIGTGDDQLISPIITVDNRAFRQIGEYVYVETEPGKTISKDIPVKYYFAQRYLTTGAISAITGSASDTQSKVDALFPLQLEEGKRYTVGYAAPADGKTQVTGYTPETAGVYTMQPLQKGIDGKNYIYLGSAKQGYIGIGTDNILGNEGDVHLWAGPMGIGTPEDIYDMPPDFTESFLVDRTTEDMQPGDVFTAGELKWIVAEIDGYGNRLIVSQDSMGDALAMPNGIYKGSDMEKSYISFFSNPKLALLKPYAQPSNGLPANGRTCVGNVAATCFPFSNEDYAACKDALNRGGLVLTGGSRTRSGAPSNMAWNVNPDGELVSANPATSVKGHAALLVRFSDAGKLVNPNSTFLPTGFTGTAGEIFRADGYNWVVLQKDTNGYSFVMTMEQITEMGARYGETNNVPALQYQNTYWPSRAITFTNKLTTLKPYARAATLPYEAPNRDLLPWKDVPIGQGLSVCTGSTANAVAFPISAGEYRDYIFTKPEMSSYMYGSIWGLRSCYQVYAVCVNGGTGAPYDGNTQSPYTPKMAIWLDLSPQIPQA